MINSDNHFVLNKKLGEDAFAIEQVYFTKTDKKVNPKKINPFKYWAGSTPILVSAPHAVRHERKKKIKVSDEFTGSIAYLLHQYTNCHALAVTKLYGGDPNYDNPCLYKEYLFQLCTKNNITFVLDLHGASKEHNFDIDMGTMNGQSLISNTKVLDILIQNFHKLGIKNTTQNNFPGIIQNTVTKFCVQELNIPAIQLEINRKYRVPHQNPEAYCRLIAALIDTIKCLN